MQEVKKFKIRQHPFVKEKQPKPPANKGAFFKHLFLQPLNVPYYI